MHSESSKKSTTTTTTTTTPSSSSSFTWTSWKETPPSSSSSWEEDTPYLVTLPAIRERCLQVYASVLQHQSLYLHVHETKLTQCMEWILHGMVNNAKKEKEAWEVPPPSRIMMKEKDPKEREKSQRVLQELYWADIPPHTRWRHYEFNVETKATKQEEEEEEKEEEKEEEEEEGLMKKRGKKRDLLQDTLLDRWTLIKIDPLEQLKRILDLMTVSVLLDAGAGKDWTFVPAVGSSSSSLTKTFHRSEGLAMAVYEMFIQGDFSSLKETHPYQVDAMGLKSLSLETLKKRFQVTEENPLVGIESRWRLLKALGNALETHAYFQSKTSLPRPGNFIDTLPPPSSSPISLSDLWPMFISLYPIPPSFPYDMGYCPLIQTWVPLHKLTQWLTYTYVEVLERFGYTVMDQEGLTGLAEYRNGGLFLDTQVITWTPQFQQTLLEQHPHPHPHPHLRQEGDNGGKKRDVSWVPVLELGHPAVLEWRACTVVLLDKLHALLNQHGFKGSLAKVLEAGTWKAGRAIAKQLRPETGAPPIQIISDGTVF